MTAVFGTPVAAVLLGGRTAVVRVASAQLHPVVVAAVAAAVARRPLHTAGPLFPFAGFMRDSASDGLACWVMRGCRPGSWPASSTQLCLWLGGRFQRLPIHWMWWPALGGLVRRSRRPHRSARAWASAMKISSDLLATANLVMKALLLQTLSVKAAYLVGGALSPGTSRWRPRTPADPRGARGRLGRGSTGPARPAFCALLGMAATLGGAMRLPLTALVRLELTGDLHMLSPADGRHRGGLCGHRAFDAPLSDLTIKYDAPRPSPRLR